MLRAVKYSAMRNMKMTLPLSRQIKKQSYLLSSASVSRLSEELNKILSSRSSASILRMMNRYGLLGQMLPQICRVNKVILEKVFKRLSSLDEKILDTRTGKGEMLKSLTEEILEEQGILNQADGGRPAFLEVEKALKALLKPLTQPNKDVEAAVKLIFSERGWPLPRKRPPRHPEVRMSELERDNAVSAKKRKRRRKKSAEKKSDIINITGENIEKNNVES
jgi:poly(A) polymerase